MAITSVALEKNSTSRQAGPGRDMTAQVPRRRVEWVDAAKGIGIFLVVLGHALGGLIKSGVLPGDGTFSSIVSFIYVFHMPLFFLLAGLFVRSSARRPLSAYVQNKTGAIAYPYILWSLLEGTLQHFTSGSNSAISLLDILYIVYEPIDQYWYLYAIFVMYLAFWVSNRIFGSAKIIFAISIALYIVEATGLDTASWSVLHSVASFFFYFCLGAVAEEAHLSASIERTGTAPLLVIVIAGFSLVMIGELAQGSANAFTRPVFAISGVCACIALAAIFDRIRTARPIVVWGIYSLEIYVAHTIFSAGVRVLLQKGLHYQGGLGHLVLGTAIGICAPIALAVVCSKLGFPYLFTANRPTPSELQNRSL